MRALPAGSAPVFGNTKSPHTVGQVVILRAASRTASAHPEALALESNLDNALSPQPLVRDQEVCRGSHEDGETGWVGGQVVGDALEGLLVRP